MTAFPRALRRFLVALPLAFGAMAAEAADLVRVGVFPVSSALPFFVARERGYFAAFDIETEEARLMGGPAVVGAMIGDQIDVAANLVTIEGMNANLLRSGVARFIAVNAQNATFQMEQFVGRKGLGASSLADLVGMGPLRAMSAPGPANIQAAKGVLEAVGLREGTDFTMTELAMNLHVDAMQAGTFDIGYTLEPNGTVMRDVGAAELIEAGVIATHLLGRPDAKAFAAGAAMTGAFVERNPDVAARFAAAWRLALADIAEDPTTRELLKGNTFTPSDVAMTMPMPEFLMADALTDQDRADYVALIRFAVDRGVLEQPIDPLDYLIELPEPAR
ncbi:MAG: ABC transporter substrate-binding protein [Rhodobacteraceae bacterium]|nr:MAG: ABC transporter substrate-binding protein [Paracoccaceae bacterium]